MSGQKKMMELISDCNKVAGYKATYESPHIKPGHLSIGWFCTGPWEIGLLMLRTGLCSLEIQRQLISAYVSVCVGYLYLREGVSSTEAFPATKFCTDIYIEIEKNSGRIISNKGPSKFIVESWMNTSQSKNSWETLRVYLRDHLDLFMKLVSILN